MDFFTALAVLACPVGMGLMMWVMMRGHGKNDHQSHPASDVEVARLRSEVERLRQAQRDGNSTSSDARRETRT
jgi:hypothetical protein